MYQASFWSSCSGPSWKSAASPPGEVTKTLFALRAPTQERCGDRVAIELSAELARALVEKILAALANDGVAHADAPAVALHAADDRDTHCVGQP
jgi:hypothetical protein